MLSTNQINAVFIDESFTDTVGVTYTDEANTENQVISVVSDYNSPAINISFNNTTITVTGKYPASVFDNNSLTVITRGSSDKLETPKQLDGFDQMDSSLQVISFKPDPRNSKTVTFTVTTNEGSESFTQIVLNEYSRSIPSLRKFV